MDRKPLFKGHTEYSSRGRWKWSTAPGTTWWVLLLQLDHTPPTERVSTRSRSRVVHGLRQAYRADVVNDQSTGQPSSLCFDGAPFNDVLAGLLVPTAFPMLLRGSECKREATMYPLPYYVLIYFILHIIYSTNHRTSPFCSCGRSRLRDSSDRKKHLARSLSRRRKSSCCVRRWGCGDLW